MKYVYFLRSVSDPEKKYSGSTLDMKRRLQEHNAGESVHTNKSKPWRLVAYFAFEDSLKADAFEKYLKSGSGHAFAKKHLW